MKANGNDPGAYSPALLAAVLAGACLGFLPHNFNPARIFMGDSGSMLIGLMLAAATTTRVGPDLPRRRTPVRRPTCSRCSRRWWRGAAVVFVPLLDLLMAVVRRTRKGMSPFSPDKMHLHHRLLEIGHSHRRAVLLIYLWAGVLAFGAVALALIDDPFVVLWAVGIGLLVAVLASAVPTGAPAELRRPGRVEIAPRIGVHRTSGTERRSGHDFSQVTARPSRSSPLW